MSEELPQGKKTKNYTVNNIAIKSLDKLDYVYALKILKGKKITKGKLIERAIDLLLQAEEAP